MDDRPWARRVAEFSRTRIQPRTAKMDDAAALDAELRQELFDTGLMSVEIPARYGGRGGTFTDVVHTIEEIARIDPGVAVIVDVQNALVTSALLRHGSGELRRRVLPRLAGGTIGAYAISEAHAGSDAFAMSTGYVRDGDDFVLSGRKYWITNAADAGVFLVFARERLADGPGPLSVFVVDAQAPGLTVGEPVDKMGIRASSTCEVLLDEVRVSAHDVLGKPGEGDLLAVRTLNRGKIGIAAQLVGLARGALDAATSYARNRTQFGEPIGSYQGVQFPLAALSAELDAARALLYQTVRAAEDDAADGIEMLRMTAAAKYVASHVAERMAAQAVETLGGNGFSRNYPVEKFYRDVKVGKIYEGTSNMQFRTIWAALSRETDDPTDVGAMTDLWQASATDGGAA